MQMTSIIIPNYNGLHWLKRCIESIRQHTHVPHEIIVVDNGSKDGSLEFCLSHRVKLVSLPFNRGFPMACNIGLRAASGDALLLLNNDTLMTPRGLENMLRCLYSGEDVGIVGPMSNFASGKQQITEPFTSVDDMAARMNQPDSAKWLEVGRIVGLCFLIRRELVNRIGLLDERFSPGHYEDDDYCHRAKQAGYRMLIAGDSFIYHHGSVSFQKENEQSVMQLIRHNRQQFIDKWGVEPLQSV
ncbi:glycosyltransferase family 2 protein [Paenibacillus radicis (ex Xue et al. 2023)]|uniref:Glycosyltransferase family 2 protein n=1 Tax=Paenibacillus radicis (ex Xue et al. 2023) TaxID=2972489 RepID=A0ABT1Y919_9BACL|nr:glycosyltransferase family 2 protein [Paenibacillus radicis (ex Xue et al. 2023)]MCR8629688.1 glycosyltransferase family 2 protein [Paenibacillus radicis (ex Xue et al. 2023)]